MDDQSWHNLIMRSNDLHCTSTSTAHPAPLTCTRPDVDTYPTFLHLLTSFTFTSKKAWKKVYIKSGGPTPPTPPTPQTLPTPPHPPTSPTIPTPPTSPIPPTLPTPLLGVGGVKPLQLLQPHQPLEPLQPLNPLPTSQPVELGIPALH